MRRCKSTPGSINGRQAGSLCRNIVSSLKSRSFDSSLIQHRNNALTIRKSGRSVTAASQLESTSSVANAAPTDIEYDAVIIGGGMGGLTTAAKLASRGCRVVVLEKYIIPGGSAGHFERNGFVFDVGSSMMFGMGNNGTTNLITRALQSVGKHVETVPDPTQIHYHLPKSEAHPEGLEVKVWRDYEDFIEELSKRFPKERAGIRKFYDECWKVFNSLNVLELKSLEEPRYLLGEFAKQPIACLTLASFLATNTGEVARKYISDPELLKFIDIECYCWSTVLADMTPMINAGMVFCDRHYGGINYPIGGVGKIPEELVDGIREHGSFVEYRSNVKEIVLDEDGKAVGARLADGRYFKGKVVISNATRWDTFGRLVNKESIPESENKFMNRYKMSPSFLSIHMGINADALPVGTECHHIIVEDWDEMEDPYGTLFVSIPSVLDTSLCPKGTHVFHAFTPDWIDNWSSLSPEEYERQKEEVSEKILIRLERIFPRLRDAVIHKEVGTPRTHRRFLNRMDGTYGPIPSRKPLGMLGMPFNRTDISGLYCVGDSTFPGQGVNAVVFSGFGCAHRVLCDIEKEPTFPVLDEGFNALLHTVRNSV